MAKNIDPKKLSADEVRRMKDEELPIVLGQLRERLFTLRMQGVSEKIEDTSQFGVIRRAVARVKGEKRRRELEAQSA